MTRTPQQEARALASIKAGCDEDVIAYHYRLVSDELGRMLRGQKPSAATARLVEIIRASDAEHDRLLFTRGTYGRAG